MDVVILVFYIMHQEGTNQNFLFIRGGGQLWIFGGEYTSPSESQFYHHKVIKDKDEELPIE